jgi:TolA-binding protein
MKIKKLALIFLIALFPSIGLADIIVTFSKGGCLVDVLGNGTWEKATIEMALTERSVIKTTSDGEMELSIDGEKIFIGKDSIVNINYILSNLQARKKITWFQSLSPILKRMSVPRDKRTQSSLLGIRGEAEGEEEITWLSETEEEEEGSTFEKGKEFYGQERYGEAINIFTKILEKGGISQQIREEATFYLGSSLFQSVQYKAAIPYLELAINKTGVYYREPALIQYSFSQYFSENYRQAFDGYAAYVKEFPVGEFKPYALLMLVKSSKALGWKDEAQKYFLELEKQYKNTGMYIDAVKELKGM